MFLVVYFIKILLQILLTKNFYNNINILSVYFFNFWNINGYFINFCISNSLIKNVEKIEKYQLFFNKYLLKLIFKNYFKMNILLV